MLEYVFFDEGLRDRFVAFAREQGVDARTSDDGGLLAMIPEEIEDTVADAIDHLYEALLVENAALLEETDDAMEKSVAGVRVELANGTPCMIRFDPDLLARLLDSISLEELRDMVQTIARAVEEPDDLPLCHFEGKTP